MLAWHLGMLAYVYVLVCPEIPWEYFCYFPPGQHLGLGQ